MVWTQKKRIATTLTLDCNMYPRKTDIFEVATLSGQITLFSWSASGGYHIYIIIIIYIYIYTHLCINCCLTVEPRYLEQFCHQKRLQTFANETGSGFKIQGSRFKIQKNFLNPETLLILAPGFKNFFWILNLES